MEEHRFRTHRLLPMEEHHCRIRHSSLMEVRRFRIRLSAQRPRRSRSRFEEKWRGETRCVFPCPVLASCIRLESWQTSLLSWKKKMLSHLIWSASAALEFLLLVRGWQCKLLRHYPLFYGYISFVLVVEVLRFLAQFAGDVVYRYSFWTFEYLAIGAGCAVVFEIYKIALDYYPGAARIARNALAFVFAMACAKGLANGVHIHQVWTEEVALNFERIVRTVQGIAITALVVLFVAYGIPFGKNLRGILLGYSLFIAERVICLTFVRPRGHDFWFYAYSASYIAVLGLWLNHLWSYQPAPEAQTRLALEQDYQALAAATQRRFRETAGFVRKVVRS
jgi:hypothetical protein